MPNLLDLIHHSMDIAVNHPLSIFREQGINPELYDTPGYYFKEKNLSIHVLFPAQDYQYVEVKYQNQVVLKAGYYSELRDEMEDGERIDSEIYHPGEWEKILDILLEETNQYIRKPKSTQERLFEKDYFW